MKPRKKRKSYYNKKAFLPIKCEECGKIFTPKREWQRFCSSACRLSNWASLNRGKKTNDAVDFASATGNY